MAKPTVGSTGWGTVLNDHLTGMETDIAARQVAANLDADTAALVTSGGATDAALSATFAPGGQAGLVLDVTKGPYNADNTGATDAGIDIQAAIDAVTAAGGGTLFLPQGSYRIDSPLVPKDDVWIRGAGRTRTILRPQGIHAAMRALRTDLDPLTGFSVTDLTIDGTDQTLDGGTYSAATKGIFIQYAEDCLFSNLHIKNVAASGLGIDFLNRVKIDYVDATNCGRLNPGGSPGGAGIGIGTGGWQVESFHVSNCTLIGNGNYGLFVERQTGIRSYGGTVTDCYAEGNRYGFVDAGMQAVSWTGCIAVGNTKSGFASNTGTIGTGTPGRYGSIVGCKSIGNTEHGYHFTNPGNTAGVSGYQIIGGTWRSNGIDGIRIELENDPVNDWLITGASIRENDECGIRFLSNAGGLIREVVVADNQIINNGIDTTAAATSRCGIHVAHSTSVGQVRGNVIADNQATKTQQYGFYVAAGASITAVDVSGNTIINNATAQVAMNGSMSYGSGFRNNVGYNDVGTITPLTLGSGINHTAGNTPEEAYVIGGSGLTIQVNGTTVHTAAPATVHLNPRDVFTVSWSGTIPTAVKVRRL